VIKIVFYFRLKEVRRVLKWWCWDGIEDEEMENEFFTFWILNLVPVIWANFSFRSCSLYKFWFSSRIITKFHENQLKLKFFDIENIQSTKQLNIQNLYFSSQDLGFLQQGANWKLRRDLGLIFVQDQDQGIVDCIQQG
jgi:hypothetical protein